jgi:hypothetical protein
MYAWILQHDDRWSFIALYVGLAVVLSVWISLFWLVALVAVHFGFECVRQAAAGARGAEVYALAGWEVKLDVALVLFALVLSLYMDVVLGVLGLQAAARAGAAANASLRAGGRVLAWERALRGVLLSVDDVAQVGRVVVRRKRGDAGVAMAQAEAPPAGAVVEWQDRSGPRRVHVERTAGWRGQWDLGDRFSVGLGAVCLALIVATPPLTGSSYGDAAATIRAELRPLPERASPAVLADDLSPRDD